MSNAAPPGSEPTGWVIRGGRLCDPGTGQDTLGDLYIAGGRIVTGARDGPGPMEEIDARGLVVAPAFIDLHVHLREPGDEGAETIASGSRAAVRGGFATIVAMPNTRPPVDSPEQVARMQDLATRAGLLEVLPAACLTRHRAGRELVDYHALAAAGAVAFTDDGNTVPDPDLMRRAMEQARACGCPIFDHAELPAGAPHGVAHAGGWAQRHGLPGIPAEAEVRAVARDVELAQATGAQVHLQHLSTAEAIGLLRAAQARGVAASAEATPHHLFFADEDMDPQDANFKMNPPLRSAADREALRQAVAEGAISVLATDHAPHPAAAKARGFLAAPFGVIGLETAMAATYTILVASGRMRIMDWLRRWTVGPAAVLGRPAPSLQPGAPANLVLLDLRTEWAVGPGGFASLSRNSPFLGLRLAGQVACTIVGGRLVYQRPDGGDKGRG